MEDAVNRVLAEYEERIAAEDRLMKSIDSSTMMGRAARHTGGKVVSLELAEYKARYAREALARAGLADRGHSCR
jgi:hypothetical protein